MDTQTQANATKTETKHTTNPSETPNDDEPNDSQIRYAVHQCDMAQDLLGTVHIATSHIVGERCVSPPHDQGVMMCCLCR